MISQHTVANHVRSILRKTGCANRTEAAATPTARPRLRRRRAGVACAVCRSILIERSFAEQLDLTDDDVRLIDDVNADEGVRWLFSFLSADRHRSYCLYEAPSAEEIWSRPGARTCRSTRSSRSTASCPKSPARSSGAACPPERAMMSA